MCSAAGDVRPVLSGQGSAAEHVPGGQAADVAGSWQHFFAHPWPCALWPTVLPHNMVRVIMTI